MFCTRCRSDLPECTCEDRDERLAAIARHPNFATDRCATCANHPEECACDEYEPVGVAE